MREAKQLAKPTYDYAAHPLEVRAKQKAPTGFKREWWTRVGVGEAETAENAHRTWGGGCMGGGWTFFFSSPASPIHSCCWCWGFGVLGWWQDDMYEWHFTIRGPEDTPFEGGVYHGIIRLPSEYPMRPPSILFLTVCAGAWE